MGVYSRQWLLHHICEQSRLYYVDKVLELQLEQQPMGVYTISRSDESNTQLNNTGNTRHPKWLPMTTSFPSQLQVIHTKNSVLHIKPVLQVSRLAFPYELKLTLIPTQRIMGAGTKHTHLPWSVVPPSSTSSSDLDWELACLAVSLKFKCRTRRFSLFYTHQQVGGAKTNICAQP